MQPNTSSLHPDVLAVLAGLDVSDRPINHPAGARVLPKEAYMSAAFHEFEKEAVFIVPGFASAVCSSCPASATTWR
jgi:hypothetical protein